VWRSWYSKTRRHWNHPSRRTHGERSTFCWLMNWKGQRASPWEFVKREFMIRSQPLIKEISRPLIIQKGLRHFGNRKNEGGRYFNLVTHEIPIREILMRSKPSHRREVRTIKLRALKCWYFKRSIVGRSEMCGSTNSQSLKSWNLDEPNYWVGPTSLGLMRT